MDRALRKHIVATARTWIGTPFHLHGRAKNIGCDCLGFIIGVCAELSLKNKHGRFLHVLDQTGYHLVCDGQFLEQNLDVNLLEVLKPNIGDLGLFSFDSNPQHLGIIADYSNDGLSIIHSHLKAGVVEQPLDEVLLTRLKKIYQFGF